jgi:hypothetical protein
MLNFLSLIPAIGGILNKIIPDPNERERIKAEMAKEMMNADSEFYKAAGSIITAEATGESWLQRNWRPITMLTFVFIIGNNYILVPYIQFMAALFGYRVIVPTLEIPTGMWGLLQIGIGGYIASRGVEKVTTSIQQGGVPLIGSRQQSVATHPVDVVTRDDLDASRRALLDELRNP